jgi:cell division protein DivIC
MFKFIKNIITKYPITKWLLNRYAIILIAFTVWFFFFDNVSFFEHRVLSKQIDELNDNKEYYSNEIKKDSLKIKQLNNKFMIEKYAREKYYMKKDSEDIYIIDIEEDRIKDSIEASKQ